VSRTVKGRRAGADSGGGQARTRLARRAVVEAARTLFVNRGYGATTIEAVSDRSEVPPATVYRLFSSKLGILKALLDMSIAGDDRAIPVLDRPEVAALLAEPDPEKLVAGFARFNVAINERSGQIYQILASAACSEPEAANVLGQYTQQRQQGQRQIARALTRAGALRADVGERDAADLIHVFMSPEVYRLLVTDRGWSRARYEQWLTDALVQQLLRPTEPPT
jgi:AcrR family transcriptional regulator